MIFFNLGISFKDIELRYGRARKRDYFSNVSTKQVTSNLFISFTGASAITPIIVNV